MLVLPVELKAGFYFPNNSWGETEEGLGRKEGLRAPCYARVAPQPLLRFWSIPRGTTVGWGRGEEQGGVCGGGVRGGTEAGRDGPSISGPLGSFSSGDNVLCLKGQCVSRAPDAVEQQARAGFAGSSRHLGNSHILPPSLAKQETEVQHPPLQPRRPQIT